MEPDWFAFEPETPAPGLSVQLNTFADVRENGSALAAWLTRARSAVEQPFLSWTEDRAFGFDEPFGYWIGLGGEDLHEQTIVLEWQDECWDFLVGELLDGRLRSFRFLGHLNDGFRLPQSELGGFLVEVDLVGLEFEDAATALVATVGRPLFGEGLPQEAESVWVDLAKQGARDFDVATGFVTIDHAGPYESPYDLSIGRYWLDGRRECRDWLRGYYWANVLSLRHIERLEGMERITQEAPCAIVEDLSDGRGLLAYLQLTTSVDRFSDDELRRLKDFLSPVLPRLQPDAWPYLGPPLRVL